MEFKVVEGRWCPVMATDIAVAIACKNTDKVCLETTENHPYAKAQNSFGFVKKYAIMSFSLAGMLQRISHWVSP